jgi:hypothetical protein
LKSVPKEQASGFVCYMKWGLILLELI